MKQLFDPSGLSKFGRLALIARTLVEGFLTGVHKSPYKGSSVEFAEHRQYYPGDEIRHIDWRAVAKTDRYYVKEFEEETNLKAQLVVDASGSMAYAGKRDLSKFDFARYLAASLAYLMLHQRDAVGLMLHDTQFRSVIQPKATSKHLLTLLSFLEQAKPGGETALAPLWHQVAEQVKRRGLIVLISDCLGKSEELLKAMQHLRHRRHDVILFQVLAPEEIEFPFSQRTEFRNLELPSDRVRVDPQGMRQEYLANFERFSRELRDACARTGVDYHRVRTDEPIDRALAIYLSRRG
jgi:uncharacterized protein (DUF58 family)